MKRSQDTRRRAVNAASASSTNNTTTASPSSSINVRTRAAEEQAGGTTPRQKQRAAQRVATQQTPGKSVVAEAVSTKAETNTGSSGGVTATSSVSNGMAANPPTPARPVSGGGLGDGKAAAVATLVPRSPAASAASTTKSSDGVGETRRVSHAPPATVTGASAAVVVVAKPMRRIVDARVTPRRPPSRDAARSPRHITVGATLVTPPPATPTSARNGGGGGSSVAAAAAAAAAAAPSPRGASPATAGGETWTPRRTSSSTSTITATTGAAPALQEVRRGSVSGPSPSSFAVSVSQRNSARRRDNSSSSARSQNTPRDLRQDVPRVVKAAPRPRPGPSSLAAQHLLDEGYYLASDGSVNSSFSDTPRSARPASLGSTSSRRTTMQLLDINAGSRAVANAPGPAVASASSRATSNVTAGPANTTTAASPTRGAVTPRGRARGTVQAISARRIRSGRSSSEGSSSSNSDIDFLEEDDADVQYDEEDEEQAVLTYMDSGAEVSYNRGRSGSGHLASPPPPRRSHAGTTASASTPFTATAAAAAGGAAMDSAAGNSGSHNMGTLPTAPAAPTDGDELDFSVELGVLDRDDVVDGGAPTRLSVNTPPLMYRRGASSLRNSSVAREPRTATPTRTKAGGPAGASTPPHASPALSAKAASPSVQPSAAAGPGGPATAALSRQHSTVAAAGGGAGTSANGAGAASQPSSRRSPLARPANQSPVQPSPLNPFSLSPYGTPASADEDARERQCKHLSLHEAFFFNQSRSFWLVDDQVLAKVLEYVRLMGYEHPALKRDRSKGQPSLWSSSSAVSSPILPGRPKKKSAAAASGTAGGSGATATGAATTTTVLKELSAKVMMANAQASPSAAAAAVADAVSQANPAAATAGASTAAASGTAGDGGAKEANNPYAFLGRQYHLKSGKPKCAGQYANTTSTSATHLFLTFNEALRWIVEQEYVIGTVLMCCARFIGDAEADGAAVIGDGTADGAAWHPRRAMLQRGKPCIPVRLHPIHFVASLVQTHYPQWGGMNAFMRTWETQIRLVLGSAAPSHQRVFKCPDDGLLLSSDLDAGNLHRVERAPEPYFFLIWLEPDNGSDKRIWFRFSVTGAKEGRTLRFRLMNAAPHAKLYRQNGMMPVWRDGLSQVNWGPADSCSFRTTNHELDGEVFFSIQARNSTETIQVAFCAPYSYADLLCHVCHWHALVKSSGCDMRFEERVLCRSPEGRKLHLLIVTSRTGGPPKSSRGEAGKKSDGVSAGSNGSAGGTQAGGGVSSTAASAANPAAAAAPAGSPSNGSSGGPNLTSPTSLAAANNTSKGKFNGGGSEVVHGPYSNFSTGKKVVLVSGRVHPGEVTASHGVHGLISFLLSSDPRAIQLREHFIFFIVPMLNPDGVSRGHSRLDQYGNNLNRCYNDPDPETQPTVLALRRVFEHLQRTYRERFIMYLDFHSHASQSSGFMFGNNLPVRVQHWNVFFPRLVELQARHVFSFGLCRFGRVHMTSKDGASRVLFGSSLIHSYTVELTHFTDRRLYADDFAAMNNGSAVLFEVTWPPLHATAGGQNTENDNNNSNNDGANTGGAHPSSPTSRGAAAAAAAATGAVFGSRGTAGKRANSSAAGQGKFAASSGAGLATARPRAASASAGSKHTGTAAGAAFGKTDASATATAGSRKRVASAGVGERGSGGNGGGGRGRSRDSPSSSSASPLRLARGGPSLQPIAHPSVLCQSAEVGRACLLALLDYCSIGRPSEELNVFGGMSRVLRDVKRQMKATSPTSSKKSKKSQAAATYAGLQPIYKQY